MVAVWNRKWVVYWMVNIGVWWRPRNRTQCFQPNHVRDNIAMYWVVQYCFSKKVAWKGKEAFIQKSGSFWLESICIEITIDFPPFAEGKEHNSLGTAPYWILFLQTRSGALIEYKNNTSHFTPASGKNHTGFGPTCMGNSKSWRP